jgi:hypothetical protein
MLAHPRRLLQHYGVRVATIFCTGSCNGPTVRIIIIAVERNSVAQVVRNRCDSQTEGISVAN